jgi:toxin ParE1/3/4
LKIRFLPKAKADLAAAMHYISADNPAVAKRWVESVKVKCAKLSEAPRIGSPRFEIRDGMRMLPHGSYVILYRDTKNLVEIVRVMHGAQNWEELF